MTKQRFGEMDAQGKDLVDLHELADALRVMGESERDVLQLLKGLVAPLPDVLQQLQIGFGAPSQHGVPVQNGASVQYGAPQNYAAQAPTMTVTGVDMNRDGIPDVLQQPQISYAAPVQQAAPAVTSSTHSEHAAPALVVDNVSHLEQCEELVTPSPQPQFHSDDVSTVGPKVTMPKWRKAHDVPVRGVVRRPSGRTRQVPLDSLAEIIGALMWRTGSAHGVNAAATLAAPAPVIEYATPVPAVTFATPAPESECATHSSAIDDISPASAETFRAHSTVASPANTMESITSGASLDAAGLANPQSPSTVVEATRVASLLERRDDFGKHLDVSLARRSEHEAAINELEKMLKEQRAVNSAGANSKKSTVGAGPSTF